MNKLEPLLAAVESQDFSALVNLASDLKTVVRILAAQPPVQALAEEMSDAKVRAALSERALTLAQHPGEGDLEHRWDAAIAAYLWLLAGKDSEQATLVAAKILAAPRCWWAKKMAEKLLSSEKLPPNASPSSQLLAGSPPAAPQHTKGPS